MEAVLGRWDRVVTAWRVLDVDKSGSISRAEFDRGLDASGLEWLSPDARRALWLRADADASGSVSYAELRDVLTGGGARPGAAAGPEREPLVVPIPAPVRSILSSSKKRKQKLARQGHATAAAASGPQRPLADPSRAGHAHSLCSAPSDGLMRVPHPQVPPSRASHLISLGASHRREVQELSRLYSKTRLRNERLSRTADELRGELRTLRSTTVTQRKKLAKAEKVSASLRCTLDSVRAKLQDKTSYLSKLEARIAYGGGEGHVLATRAAELQKLVKTLKAQCSESRQRAEAAEKKLGVQQSELAILKRSVEAASKTVDGQNHTTVASLLHERARLEAENLHLARSNARLQAEHKTLAETVESTRRSLKSEVAARAQAEDAAREGKQAVAKLDREKTSLVDYVEELLAKEKKGAAREADKELLVVKLQKRALQAQTEAEGARAAAASRERAADRASEELREARAALEAARADAKRARDEQAARADRVSTLHAEVDELTEANQRLQAQIGRQRAQQEESERKLLGAQSQEGAAQHRLRATLRAFERLMGEKSHLQVQLKEALARCTAHEVVRRRLEHETRRLNKRIGDLLYDKQRQQRDRRHAQLSRLSQDLSRLDAGRRDDPQQTAALSTPARVRREPVPRATPARTPLATPLGRRSQANPSQPAGGATESFSAASAAAAGSRSFFPLKRRAFAEARPPPEAEAPVAGPEPDATLQTYVVPEAAVERKESATERSSSGAADAKGDTRNSAQQPNPTLLELASLPL